MSTSDSIAIGFGFVPGETTHYFLVTIPRGEAGDVIIAGPLSVAPGEAGNRINVGHFANHSDTERSMEEEEAPRETPPLATLSLERWLCIEHAVRVEFNRRLHRIKLKSGIWKNGDNLLAISYGKELTLLCWAIAEAGVEEVANALLNWAWFTPEERQQLYDIVAALSGGPEQAAESAWRRAIRIALVETAAADRPIRPKPQFKTPVSTPAPAAESPKSRRKRPNLDSLLAQPMLPCMEEKNEG